MAAPSFTGTVQRASLWFLALLGLSHGVVDLGAGAVVALLPALREKFNLSYTLVGNIMLFSTLTSSLTQPIFGWLSDQAEKRWIVPLSLVLSGIGVAAIGFMPGYWLVVAAVVFQALGVASFHPEGAHAAHNLGGTHQARAMAIYSVGGNMGYAIGTIYGAGMIALLPALRGTSVGFILPGLLALAIWRLLPQWQATERAVAEGKRRSRADLPETNLKGTVLLTLMVIVRSIINLGVTSYMPFYWIDVLGNDPRSAVYVQLTYLISGVFGTLFGAPLADRIGTKPTLILSFVLLLPLQAALPFLSGVPLLVTLFLSGFVVVSTFTVTLVMTQQYMPRALGLASGINLGLAFGMGGVGAVILGVISDRWGVVTGLWCITALVPVTLLLSAVLPPVRWKKAE